MSDSNKKDIRKQIRNLLPAILTTEVVEALTKEMNRRVDVINAYCVKALDEQNQRAKNIQGFILGEVKGRISNDLYNMEVTMLAWEEVMQSRLGINLTDLAPEIDEKKKEIQKRLEAEAVARQQEALKGKEVPSESESV